MKISHLWRVYRCFQKVWYPCHFSPVFFLGGEVGWWWGQTLLAKLAIKLPTHEGVWCRRLSEPCPLTLSCYLSQSLDSAVNTLKKHSVFMRNMGFFFYPTPLLTSSKCSSCSVYSFRHCLKLLDTRFSSWVSGLLFALTRLLVSTALSLMVAI